MMSQITIDFTAAGLLKGLKGAVRVIGYHVLTDAILVIGAYLSSVHFSTSTDTQAAALAATIAVANAVLKFLGDWLSTKGYSLPSSEAAGNVA